MSTTEESANLITSPSLPFRPVHLTRAHELVVDQIVYSIRSGLLRPGDRLPTIETLANLTGVSKPVVGDAVQVLRGHGVLETKRGIKGGVTVTSDDIPPSLMWIACDWRDATLTELVEARRPIETDLALLAAERATDHDLEQMRESLDLLRRAIAEDSKGSFFRYDHLFHYRIGLAARSRLLSSFQHRVLCGIAAILYEYDLYHEDPELVINTHRSILAALELRDSQRIREAVDSHWRTSSGAFADLQDLSRADEGTSSG